MSESKTITFTLDGKEVVAREGETIWQVAQRHGTSIPHLCYAPEPGYRPDGNCRACVVEIEGERVGIRGGEAAFVEDDLQVVFGGGELGDEEVLDVVDRADGGADEGVVV